MAIIENNIKLEHGFIAESLRLIKEFFNQPIWLIILLVISITMGLSYYLYTRNEYIQTIEVLQTEINQLTLIVYNNVNKDEYTKTLFNLITELTLLKHAQDLDYNIDVQQLDVIERFVKRKYPYDPIIGDIDIIRIRKKTAQESYTQEYVYILNRLKTLFNASGDSCYIFYEDTQINK